MSTEHLHNEYLHEMGIQPYTLKGKPTAMSDSTQRDNKTQWELLKQQVTNCTACSLHQTRTQTVFGVGSTKAKLVFVGEAPGQQEDLKGEPFVGKAGQLLDQMLLSIGLKREEIYIANILKCRPPNNRDPNIEEQHCCTPFLLQQLKLLKPRLIVSLGRISAQYLLQSQLPLSRLRMQQHSYSDANIPLWVTYHPAYLLRSPSEKAKAWEDLLKIKEYLSELNPSRDRL